MAQVHVSLPEPLRRFAGEQAVLDIASAEATVAGVLQALATGYPELAQSLIRRDGHLVPGAVLFYNGLDIRFTGGMETPIADGGMVSITIAYGV